jgi:hypothetical protein
MTRRQPVDDRVFPAAAFDESLCKGEAMTPPAKPNLHEAILLDLTPNEIFQACLYGSHVTDADLTSALVPGVATEVLVAENKRTGNAARFARLNLSELPQYVVELQIGSTFIAGFWQWATIDASQSEIEYNKEQAQNAFIRAAGLVGKRVERELVIR